MSTVRSRPPVGEPQEELIGALVPAFAASHAEPVRLPDLPPPRPVEPSGMDPVVGMARVDRTGRVREQSVFDALGWQPGRRLRLEIVDEVIVLAADPAGRHRVDQRGAVTLPAAARQMCAIERGPALLVVGLPHERALFVHSATIVTRLLADFYDEILGGSR